MIIYIIQLRKEELFSNKTINTSKIVNEICTYTIGGLRIILLEYYYLLQNFG